MVVSGYRKWGLRWISGADFFELLLKWSFDENGRFSVVFAGQVAVKCVANVANVCVFLAGERALSALLESALAVFGILGGYLYGVSV